MLSAGLTPIRDEKSLRRQRCFKWLAAFLILFPSIIPFLGKYVPFWTLRCYNSHVVPSVYGMQSLSNMLLILMFYFAIRSKIFMCLENDKLREFYEDQRYESINQDGVSKNEEGE